jgi:site-specific recombinase XerD
VRREVPESTEIELVSKVTSADTLPESLKQSAVGAGDHFLKITGALVMYRRQMQPVLRPRTLTQQTYVIESFARYNKDMAIKAVKAKHVAEWLAHMEVQASTVRARISVIRTFFKWAQERDLLRRDPTIGIRVPRQPRALPRSLSLDDLRQLGSALPDVRAKLIVSLMVDMGLRAGEVAGLEMADVDLFSNVARIVGKGGHERMLPIPEGTRYFLDAYIQERGRGGGFLIRSYKDEHLGISPGCVSNLLTQWFKDAGIKAERYDGRSAHALRHTTAENLYRHGVDLRTIAAAMGHASPTTTWIYLRHRENVETLRQVMGQRMIDEVRPPLRGVPAPYDRPSHLKEAGGGLGA